MFNTYKYVKESEIEGDIPSFSVTSKRVMKIVWPSMIEAFLVALVTLFDGIMVGTLGNEANGAVTITKQPIFTLICLITALNICVTAIIARRKGQGDEVSANKALHMGLLGSLSIAIIVGGLMAFFAEPVCKLMGATELTIGLSTSYLRIISLGFVFNALRLTINTAQRAVGKTHVSLATNIVANLVNVTLNYLLITGKFGFPALGIEGAAIATVIGNSVAFGLSFLSILNTKFNKKIEVIDSDGNPKEFSLRLRIQELFKFDLEVFHTFIKLFPNAVFEQLMMRIGFILFAMIVNKLGDDPTYVNGVCNDINSLIFTLSDGFAIGTAALVGHRIGEGRKDLAIVYAKVSMMISVFVAVIVCGIMLCTRGLLIDLYRPATPELKQLGMNVLIIASFTAIPQNIQWVITGVLRGSGDTKFTAKTSLLSITIIRPIITYLLCYSLGFGLYGAWIAMFVDQAIRCSLNIWRFKSRAWINIRV